MYKSVSRKKVPLLFLDPEGGSQKATLVVVLIVVVVVNSSLKIPPAFLIRSGAQRNFAHVHIRADIAHRSTVSDFSIIL